MRPTVLTIVLQSVHLHPPSAVNRSQQLTGDCFSPVESRAPNSAGIYMSFVSAVTQSPKQRLKTPKWGSHSKVVFGCEGRRTSWQGKGQRVRAPSLQHAAARRAEYFSVKLHGRSGNSWGKLWRMQRAWDENTLACLLLPSKMNRKHVSFTSSYIYSTTIAVRAANSSHNHSILMFWCHLLPSLEKEKTECSSSGNCLGSFADIKSCCNFFCEWIVESQRRHA